MNGKTAIIILAAGKGTRMKSDKAKVLHPLLGRPMIQYVVNAAVDVAKGNVIVVVGHQSTRVREAIPGDFEVDFAEQKEQLGTGHAVLCALPFIGEGLDRVVVLCGDVPLIRSGTIRDLIKEHNEKSNDITILGIELSNPYGYGRIVLNDAEQVTLIVEESDASLSEKSIKSVNSGIYCIDREVLIRLLHLIKPDNAQRELYLTDIIGIGYSNHYKIGLFVGDDAGEVTGINTLDDLFGVEELMQKMDRKIS